MTTTTAPIDRWSRGVLAHVVRCPVCDAADRALHASAVFDHLHPDGPDRWQVWRCARCASLYLDPRPDDASIGRAYDAYYTHSTHTPANGDGRELGLAWSLVHGYMNRRFDARVEPAFRIGYPILAAVEPLRLKLDYHGRHLFRALTKHSGERSVLDVGCGNGEFVVRARQLGWRGVGVDPDPAAVAACRHQGVEAHVGNVEDLPASFDGMFDMVTLRHSIEHGPAPRAQIRACHRRLRDGGVLWMAWPNPQGLGSRLFRSSWRGLEVPRHLCIPSIGAAISMLTDAGFIDVRVERRGHHARSITRESARIARLRPGWANRLRGIVGAWIGPVADVLATIGGRFGEELVVTARRGMARA